MNKIKNKSCAMSHNVWYVNNTPITSGYHACVKKYDGCGSRYFYIDKSLLSDRVDRPRVRVFRDLFPGVYTTCEGIAIALSVNGVRRAVLVEDDRGSRFTSSGFSKLYRLHD